MALGGTSAGTDDFLALHYPSSSQTLGTTSTLKVALHVLSAAAHMYIFLLDQAEWNKYCIMISDLV